VNTTSIADVSDTARWVAYFRGMESARPDRLFNDSFALRLAGDRGRAIAESMPKGPLPWSLAVRTRAFDELITETVARDGIDTVLNLAAGLDARPYRLPLPANLRWVEVDLPSILTEKENLLAGEQAACAVERVGLDLARKVERRELIGRIGAAAKRVLVVSEGLLAYLDEATVGALAEELRHSLPEPRWLIDNVAPDVLARLKRNWDGRLTPGNATMKFAPANGLSFFEERGWHTRTTRSLLDEAERLGREMPIVKVIRIVGRWVPPISRAYARRQAELRDKVVYALLDSTPDARIGCGFQERAIRACRPDSAS
jgi:methyltransferase (TIGR00027 family)